MTLNNAARLSLAALAAASALGLAACEDSDDLEAKIDVFEVIGGNAEVSDGEVELATTMEFYGGGSKGADTYVWKLIRQPEGGEEQTIASNRSVRVAFQPALAGEYVVELEVEEDGGDASDTAVAGFLVVDPATTNE